MSEKKVYFNKPQRLTQLIGANTTVIVAGRRTGKTDSIAAPFVLPQLHLQYQYPRAGVLNAPTHSLAEQSERLLLVYQPFQK